jgi:hypothetical protein
MISQFLTPSIVRVFKILKSIFHDPENQILLPWIATHGNVCEWDVDPEGIE